MVEVVRSKRKEEKDGKVAPDPSLHRRDGPAALARIRSESCLCVDDALLLLGRVFTVRGRAGARRTQKQLLAVRQRQVASVRALRSVFRLVTVDQDFGSRQ